MNTNTIYIENLPIEKGLTMGVCNAQRALSGRFVCIQPCSIVSYEKSKRWARAIHDTCPLGAFVRAQPCNLV